MAKYWSPPKHSEPSVETVSKEELLKEYTARILDLEEEAHGKLAADEAMLSMLMGEGYRDPNYPKQIADPEFSDVAESFNQWALSPPPKSYPGKTSGRVLSSREMGLPLFNRLPNKEARGLSGLLSPGEPVSGLSSGFRGLHYPGQRGSRTADRVEYRGSGDTLAKTIKHEFAHRVDFRSDYSRQLGARLKDFVPKDNFWSLHPVYARYYAPPLKEILAHSYAHKLVGGSLDDEELKKDIKRRVAGFKWKNTEVKDKAVEDAVTLAPLLVADFEKYLQEQEVDRPTQLSREKYPEWLYGDRSSMGKWLRRSGRMAELENELDD